jgi:hypothetical protein
MIMTTEKPTTYIVIWHAKLDIPELPRRNRVVAEIEAKDRDDGWEQVEKLHTDILKQYGEGILLMVALGDGRQIEFPGAKRRGA